MYLWLVYTCIWLLSLWSVLKTKLVPLPPNTQYLVEGTMCEFPIVPHGLNLVVSCLTCSSSILYPTSMLNSWPMGLTCLLEVRSRED